MITSLSELYFTLGSEDLFCWNNWQHYKQLNAMEIVRLDLTFTMKDIYINSKLKGLTKFTSRRVDHFPEKEPITSQKLGSRDFWRIANTVINKGKSAIPPVFNDPDVSYSASGKAKLFAENSFKNSNLDGSGISLLVFSSRTNIKLHNLSVTPKMFKKIIKNLHLSRPSPDWI